MRSSAQVYEGPTPVHRNQILRMELVKREKGEGGKERGKEGGRKGGRGGVRNRGMRERKGREGGRGGGSSTSYRYTVVVGVVIFSSIIRCLNLLY